MTDQQIIALFQQRDEQAVHETFRKYGAACLRNARKYLNTQEDAEECVNDVMMKLWRAIPPAAPENLEAFLATITQRTAIDMQSKASAQKRGGGRSPVPLDGISEAVPASEGVEDIIQQRLLTEAVERFLDTLSDDAQTIFTERWHNETAPRDIARKFGLSGPHVRKSLMRTRRKLEAYLKKEGLL
ncbi:MAG: RNA polymerase sigma factor [Oscillospiraceae bacterium]|nr:RNA polymerase sigma factor [Oscillospiraceae bacterium]